MALIFCINNLSYLNARCLLSGKLYSAQYTWKTFLIWHKGDLSKWNRLGSKREGGSGRAGVVSLMGNKGVKKAPVLGQKAESVSREAVTPTCSGRHLTLGIGSCHLCIFAVIIICNSHEKHTITLFYRVLLVAACGDRGSSFWCSGSAAWAPALSLWAKHHSSC